MTAIATPFEMVGNARAQGRMTGVINNILQQQRGISGTSQRLSQANVAQNNPANYASNQQAAASQFEDRMGQEATGGSGKFAPSATDKAANALSNVAAGEEQGWRDAAVKQFASNLLTGSQLSTQAQLARLVNAPAQARLNAAGQMDPWIQTVLTMLQQGGQGADAAYHSGAFNLGGGGGGSDGGGSPASTNPGPVNLP